MAVIEETGNHSIEYRNTGHRNTGNRSTGNRIPSSTKVWSFLFFGMDVCCESMVICCILGGNPQKMVVFPSSVGFWGDSIAFFETAGKISGVVETDGESDLCDGHIGL